jgi:hypothetical protein
MTKVTAKSDGAKERNPVCATCTRERECGQFPWADVINCPKMAPLDRGGGSRGSEKRT